MSYLYKSISGDTATILIGTDLYHTETDFIYSLESVVITNTHATDSCTVDLYLFKRTSAMDHPGHLGNWDAATVTETTHYFIKGVSIPAGTTLSLEGHDISYNIDDFSLVYIKLGDSGSTVDVKNYFSQKNKSETVYKRSRIIDNSPGFGAGRSGPTSGNYI